MVTSTFDIGPAINTAINFIRPRVRTQYQYLLTDGSLLDDLGLDTLDRDSIANDIELALLIEIPDIEARSWTRISDVARSISYHTKAGV